MIAGPFELAIEVERDGELVGEGPASAAACVEHALFRGVQAGSHPNDGTQPALTLTPLWSAAEGSAITGLTLALEGGVAEPFELEVFASQARALIQSLVAEGRVAKGELVEWSVKTRERAAGPGFRARSVRAPYPLRSAALPDVPEDATEVCFEAGVLRRIRDRVDGVERAALLLGRLLHDPLRRAIRLLVTDAVEVEPGPGGASDSHFAFAPGSFAAARRMARSRADGAIPCGWAHTHPACAGCAARPDCRTDTVFFSADDVAVHASAFPSAWAIALVAGKLAHLPAARPGFRLYGWSSARVGERPFRVVGPGADGWAEGEQGFIDPKESAR